MKELEKHFIGRGEVRGFDFRQIKSNARAYLYQVRTPLDGRIHYEIFKRKANTRFNCISYPGSKAFGDWATTTRDYQKAVFLYNEMAKQALSPSSWTDGQKNMKVQKTAIRH